MFDFLGTIQPTLKAPEKIQKKKNRIKNYYSSLVTKISTKHCRKTDYIGDPGKGKYNKQDTKKLYKSI